MRKKALRKDFFMEIRKSLGRYLSIFFIVALGVSLFVGLQATEPNMILSGDAYADENKLMDKVVSTYGLTQDDKEAIEKLATVENAEGSYSIDALCEVGENQKVIHIMAETESMNKVTVAEGRLPENEKECLLDQDFMEASGYEIGDIITFLSGTNEELTETLKTNSFQIVGTGNTPLYFSEDKGSSTVGNGSVSGFAIVQPKAFDSNVFTEIYIQVDGAKECLAFTEEYENQIEDTVQQIEQIQEAQCEARREELVEEALKIMKETMESQMGVDASLWTGEISADMQSEIDKIELPSWYIFDRTSIPEYKGYGDNAARIAALSVVFPTMFFLVAALISLTTMTRMVEEQRVQIGTMKALGYSGFDIIKKYLNYALTATVGGSVFGTLIGGKLFPYVIIMAYKIVYIHIPHALIPYHGKYALIATGLAAFCTGTATIVACYKELKSQPAILMRPEAPKSGKRTLIEKIPFLWKRLSFTWKSTLRNMFRYKKRFFMTLFGIGGCMGLLMVGFGLRDSISSIAAIQYGELQLYDSSIFISEEMDEKTRSELVKYFDEKNEIAMYMDVHMSNITLEHEEEKLDAYMTVIGEKNLPELSSFFVYRNRTSHENYELSDEGVILSEKTAKMLGAEVGDSICLTGEGKKERTAKVDAICENYAGHYVYMTSEYYENLYAEEAFPNTILLRCKEGLAFERLQEIGEEVLEYDTILSVQYTESLSKQMDDMLFALDKVMGLLIAVAGMLSFVVMYNLNNINITERRRELATLKVLGFYDGEVAAYVYRENILLTLIGTAAGCCAGKLLHLFTITTVEVDNMMFGREIYPMSYLHGAFFTISFSFFVNWIMYYKLKKINMVESLKSVE